MGQQEPDRDGVRWKGLRKRRLLLAFVSGVLAVRARPVLRIHSVFDGRTE